MVNDRLSTYIVLIWNFLYWQIEVYANIRVKNIWKWGFFLLGFVLHFSYKGLRLFIIYLMWKQYIQFFLSRRLFLIEWRNKILKVYLRGTAVLWRGVHVPTTKECNRVTWQNDCDPLVTNQEQSKYKIAPT